MSNSGSNRHAPPTGLCSRLRRYGIEIANLCLKRFFHDIPRITTSELAAWLEDRTRPAPLLLDVRSRTEYETSFIDGARWLDPGPDTRRILELKAELASNPRPVIVYCSVGYRSARFARALLAADVVPVYNLEGSIFAWANEGRALHNARGATRGVHPYNAVFGLLLEKQQRAARRDRKEPRARGSK